MIRIKTRRLRAAGLLCLLLPAAAFLLTWVRPVIAIPSAAMLAAALCLFMRRDRVSPAADAFGDNDELCISVLSLLAVIACAVVGASYVWRRNTLLSIILGTACYMLMAQWVF